jgi:hypothetical protein
LVRSFSAGLEAAEFAIPKLKTDTRIHIHGAGYVQALGRKLIDNDPALRLRLAIGRRDKAKRGNQYGGKN